MVDEQKLKITYELLEMQVDERLKRELKHLEERMKPKIKKRLKQKDLNVQLQGKVNMAEFKKGIERLDNNV